MNYITALQMPLGFGRIHVSAATIWMWSYWTPPLSLPLSDSLHLFFLLQDFSCWTSSPPFSFCSPSSIYVLYPSSKFLNPDSSSFSILIFISSGVPLCWSVLPRPRVFYFSLHPPPLHPAIFPSLPLFPHPLTISSPDRPQTSLVSFKEISPGKKSTWRSQLPFPYKTPVKKITYNSWIFAFLEFPLVNMMCHFPTGNMTKLTDFSKTGVEWKPSAVTALEDVGHIWCRGVSVSRSQDRKIDVVTLWVLASARNV